MAQVGKGEEKAGALVMDPNLASFRNVMRLVTELVPRIPQGLRIAEALHQSRSIFEAQKKRDGGDVCCPLPFSLQDLCLLVVVSDLDFHQVKLLASLPQWLRHRLLNILPALDLCRLEHTPVATGVDVDVIWNSRWKEEKNLAPGRNPVQSPLNLGCYLQSRSSSEESTESVFQLNVGKVDDVLVSRLRVSPNRPDDDVLLKEMKSAFQGLEECKFPHGKKGLLKLASDILANRKIDLDMAANKLISIQGDVVYSNLLTGIRHQPCATSQCSQNVWKKQASGLVVNAYSLQERIWSERSYLYTGREQVRNIQLTPHRLLHILYRRDPLELLTLLTGDCNLQPSSANIHIDSISQSFLLDLCVESLRLALDGSFSLPSDSATCTSIVGRFLEKVIILRLQCDSYSNIGVMIGMIKAATVNGEDSQLKHLFCAVPNIYMDTVQPFTTLFSLQNFHQLTLEVDEVHLLMLSKLLQGFMTAQCSHTHKLMIHSKKGILLPTSLETNRLATLGRGVTLPSSSAEHKILQFSSQKEFTSALYLLLQFPTIRLKEIALVNLSEYYQYLHLCAIHPDLQTTKLVIDIGRLLTPQSSTIRADLVSLFKIPPLQKICISGNWGEHAEVKLGLVQGLHGRSRLPPLKKIALELELANSYKMRDFRMLCDAIFSLPQLQDLKVVLGKGYADMIRQPGYEGVMYTSWIQRAPQVQLKSLCLQTYKTKFEQLSLITQELSFSSKPKRYPTPQMYPHSDSWFDSMYFLGDVSDEYYDDDDYVYYDDDDF